MECLSRLDFPGAEILLSDDAYIVTSRNAWYTVSSAVVGGGFQSTHTIINRHVPRNYYCTSPAQDLQGFALSLHVREPFVGMLTGVPIDGTRIVTLRQDDITVASIITAGVGNAVTSGVSEPLPFVPGTINITVLVDAQLVPAAMVNAIITATEAKVGVLVDCHVQSPAGTFATGTSTDAIVVACTGRGDALPYAGPGTDVGYLIGRSVRQGLMKALEPCGIFYEDSVMQTDENGGR
ncbi:MAG TPA: adenosylcobinamide amidohydrolase [Dictyobacter sp.]|nr:adenosylcobinamide amidohydrolase [Dictyobacter sp.]